MTTKTPPPPQKKRKRKKEYEYEHGDRSRNITREDGARDGNLRSTHAFPSKNSQVGAGAIPIRSRSPRSTQPSPTKNSELEPEPPQSETEPLLTQSIMGRQVPLVTCATCGHMYSLQQSEVQKQFQGLQKDSWAEEGSAWLDHQPLMQQSDPEQSKWQRWHGSTKCSTRSRKCRASEIAGLQ